jgi:AcrR family transcriptional regulator
VKPDTKQRLLDGTLETVRRGGIAAVSARSIAAAAGVNQALIFYHFGSVDELLEAACRQATEARIALYRERFATVSSLTQLLAVGRELHDAERTAGNVAVLAQLLAGAPGQPRLAVAVGESLAAWTTEIEAVLDRVLGTSPLADVADLPGLARAVAASFVGIELYDGVDPQGAAAALDALDQLSVLIDVFDDLGPVARRALAARTRKARRARVP